MLGPFELPSNHLSRTMYDTLPMPWSLDPPVKEFPPADFMRKEWNRDGKLESGAAEFFESEGERSLEELANSLDTASMVTRWREAYPGLARTDKDCVAMTMRRIADAMGADKDDLAGIRLKLGSATALLLFNKRMD